MHWFSLILGVLIGWVIEWVIDFMYWRRRYNECRDARGQLQAELQGVRSDLWETHEKAVQVKSLQTDLTDAHTQVKTLEEQLADWKLRAETAEARLALTSQVDANELTDFSPAMDARLSATASAGDLFATAASVAADDLEVIEGIGPAIARILKDNNIRTFLALAAATPAELKTVLEAAGPRFRMANPESWPEQAALAARGAWDALKEMQGRLRAGRA